MVTLFLDKLNPSIIISIHTVIITITIPSSETSSTSSFAVDASDAKESLRGELQTLILRSHHKDCRLIDASSDGDIDRNRCCRDSLTMYCLSDVVVLGSSGARFTGRSYPRSFFAAAYKSLRGDRNHETIPATKACLTCQYSLGD